ncbi:MAG: hypothetical protein IT452_18465 [Planctomycetia bacterium]|nr:hypothetical protein [Planctomycetia bacterium]
MAQIRAESALPAREAAKVTPIRGFTVFTRLVAGIAAIFMVWVGVRALRVEPVPVRKDTAAGEPANEKVGATERSFKKGNAPDEAGSWAAETKKSKGVELKSGSGLGVDPAPMPPNGPAKELPVTDAAAAAPAPADPGLLAVQRITVYSTDVAADAARLRDLLGESGYTFSTQKQAILVRVPASEATRLVASLGEMKREFRAGERRSLGDVQRAQHAKNEESREKDKDAGAKDEATKGLTAGADELEEALERHIEESRREIRKKESLRKSLEKQGESRGGMVAGGPSKSDAKEREDADRRDGKAPGLGQGYAENEAGQQEAGKAPATAGASGGGRPEDGVRQEEHLADGGKLEHGEGKAGAPAGDDGGTDDLAGRSRREKDLADELARELDKLESSRKLADAEDAVVLYIEFEAPAPGPDSPKSDPAGSK